MSRRVTLSALPAALTALLVTGCGISNPYQARHPAATGPSTVTGATATSTTAGTGAGPVDPSERAAGTYPPGALTTRPTGTTTAASEAAATPQDALERYAQIDTNWTATTLADSQRGLAQLSVGAARAAALQAAASYGRDPILLHSQVTNTGTVVAITPGRGAAAGDWVVVTTERTTGTGQYAGLPAQLHVIYATVTHTTTGWEVSAWSPRT